jgi:catechol 2,3-dioxygenase-like lactoylglutathione lyase family enzyme
MITGLDHLVLITPDLDAGIAAYTTVLGLAPSWRGAGSAIFALGNTALELVAPAGDTADTVNAALAADGEGLASLCFAVADLDKAHRSFDRRALQPGHITDGAGDYNGQHLTWKRFRADREATHGIRHFFIHRDMPLPRTEPALPAPVTALDHVVVSTSHPNRAAALYGARLGLDMALDRTNPEWDMRLMFFRCGDLIVEIAHRLSEPAGDAPDRFYGLTWRTNDLDGTRARLIESGLDVSNIRPGRKPGSRVFSLKNGTLNVPTLFIGS